MGDYRRIKVITENFRCLKLGRLNQRGHADGYDPRYRVVIHGVTFLATEFWQVESFPGGYTDRIRLLPMDIYQYKLQLL